MGSATTSATTRGNASTSIGSSPMVRKASISSRIFIEPSSAVKALPDRPATMIATISTPSSRKTSTPTRLTTYSSAPNLRK